MSQDYVVRPEDTERRVLSMVEAAICEINEAGHPAAVTVKRYRRKKTPRQHRTIFMWNGEVASHLTMRGKDRGILVNWTAEDVHEVIFKPRFMPQRELILPNGKVKQRPKGLSDPDTTAKEVSDAMEAYLAWIYTEGMEVTIPPDPLVEQIAGNVGW